MQFFYDSTYIDVIKEIQNKLKDLKIYIKFNEFNKCIEEGKIILKSGRRHFVFERIRNEETAAIFYTCTISSKMRGIELSHENIMSAALSNSQLVFFGDMTMAVIPFHYVFSIISELISPLIQKSTVIYPME